LVEEWKSLRRKVTSGCEFCEQGNPFWLLRTTSSSWLACTGDENYLEDGG
jgi:hypothetical protein